MKKIIIAVDGYSSCGKSTLARQLAASLGYKYIDSGAMYRAVTLYFLNNNVDLRDNLSIEKALNEIKIDFATTDNGLQHILLNNRDVESEIREMRISKMVSEVSSISMVRRKLVAMQAEYGREGGVVMDGRDIGTVVFPNAELKIFMSASPEVRAERRRLELEQAGKTATYDEIIENLKHRDHIDTTRSDSPLKQAKDAILLDNSNLNREAQLALAMAWSKEKMLAEQRT